MAERSQDGTVDGLEAVGSVAGLALRYGNNNYLYIGTLTMLKDGNAADPHTATAAPRDRRYRCESTRPSQGLPVLLDLGSKKLSYCDKLYIPLASCDLSVVSICPFQLYIN